MRIHGNFMNTALYLIVSVLWLFLIYNIAILKKDLAASYVDILFTLMQDWSVCVPRVYKLNLRCHI